MNHSKCKKTEAKNKQQKVYKNDCSQKSTTASVKNNYGKKSTTASVKTTKAKNQQQQVYTK